MDAMQFFHNLKMFKTTTLEIIKVISISEVKVRYIAIEN